MFRKEPMLAHLASFSFRETVCERSTVCDIDYAQILLMCHEVS